MAFISMGVVFFIFHDLPKGIIDWNHNGPILIGVLIVLAVGDVIIRWAEKAREKLVLSVK